MCVCVETDSQRKGQRGACRETQERTDWLGSNTDRYSTHTLPHTHTRRVIRLTHSCPFHTTRARTCTDTYHVSLRVERTLVSVVTKSSERLVHVCECVTPPYLGISEGGIVLPAGSLCSEVR